MIRYLSDLLNATQEDFEATGAFNPILGIDSQLFIDPKLLQITTTTELKGSYAKFRTHFDNILQILIPVQNEDDSDPFWKKASELMEAKEVPGIAIGYAKDNSGRGLGKKLGNTILNTARKIIKAGIQNPTLFELVGVFEEGIGSDRISDMVASVIKDDLIAYSQRVFKGFDCSKLKLDTKTGLPLNEGGKPIILVPSEVLLPLPVASCWEDRDLVCEHNADLRKELNGLIGDSWRKAVRSRQVSKDDLKAILIAHPEALMNMIEIYEKKTGKPYDFQADPLGLFKWIRIAIDTAKADPISGAQIPTTESEFNAITIKVLDKFKSLVENNALRDALFTDGGKQRKEHILQKTLYAVADTYCEPLNIDVNREVNNGRGPVDFKFSLGRQLKVVVECKWGNSQQLIHAFDVQVSEYAKADNTKNMVLLVVDTGSQASKKYIKELVAHVEARAKTGVKIPKVVFINAEKKDSASKYEPPEDPDDSEVE